MGDQGTTGGAWGARDDASWWPGGGAGEINQQQLNENIARSTAAPTHQLYTYKMTNSFSNSGGDNSTSNYDYRMISGSNNREESPQQTWWYSSGSVESHQSASSPTPQNQSSPDPEGQSSQPNGIQSDQNQAIQQNQLQQLQQQNLQQVLQQQNQALQQNQTLQQNMQQDNQQTLQQMLQQHQQQQALVSLQQTLQVSQAQAQAIVQAQAALQQQVAQAAQVAGLAQHQLHPSQQQIHQALQRQTASLQDLQQQQQQQQQPQQQVLLQTPARRQPRARAFNKPRGRMTAYAFFVQTCREEHKKKYPDENVIFAAFSKKCAERWNTMSEKEKARFHALAEQDKRRYELEMQSYVPPHDAKAKTRKRHHIKDPNAPKRSLSAFFWFCNHERSKVKADRPESTMADIAKELGRRWAAADPDTKGKFEALSDQDKARYDREMTAYKKGPLAQVQLQQQLAHAEVEAEGEYAGENEEYK